MEAVVVLNEKNMELLKLTKTLMDYNDEAKQQYLYTTQQEGYEVDFYNKVKPFVDQVELVAKQWKVLAEEWVKAEDPKYIHLPQIEDTYDNIMISSVTAFQVRTRKRKLFNTISSIAYVLENIEKALRTKEV